MAEVSNSFYFPGFLTGHPARKFVIDFLRMIVVDSLSQPVVSKSNTTVIDIMLDVSLICFLLHALVSDIGLHCFPSFLLWEPRH